MPAWQSGVGVAVRAGQRVPVLNNETIANNAASEAVYLDMPGPTGLASVTVVNEAAGSVTLQCSADGGLTFYPMYQNAALVQPNATTAAFAFMSPSLWLRVVNSSGGALNNATVWLCF